MKGFFSFFSSKTVGSRASELRVSHCVEVLYFVRQVIVDESDLLYLSRAVVLTREVVEVMLDLQRAHVGEVLERLLIDFLDDFVAFADDGQVGDVLFLIDLGVFEKFLCFQVPQNVFYFAQRRVRLLELFVDARCVLGVLVEVAGEEVEVFSLEFLLNELDHVAAVRVPLHERVADFEVFVVDFEYFFVAVLEHVRVRCYVLIRGVL